MIIVSKVAQGHHQTVGQIYLLCLMPNDHFFNELFDFLSETIKAITLNTPTSEGFVFVDFNVCNKNSLYSTYTDPQWKAVR